MTKRFIALVILVGALAPMGAARAVPPNDGCYVYGEVLGLDTQRNCTYTALKTDQIVYVATPYEWRVWVLRSAPNGQPLDVTLASGTGPVAGPPPVAHPIMGETVHVTMWTGCTPPFCGTIGFLAAGLEQGTP